MLYILNYNSLNAFFSYNLTILEFVFILLGIYVIISKNPILSVLYLISLFLVVSLYLLILGIYFIGISYLLVYIGAVSILFLFILMLIDIRISELHTDTMNNTILGGLIAIGFYYPIMNIKILSKNTNKEDAFYVTYNSWEGFISENIDIQAIGNVLYTNFSLWLILSLLILLLSMVGAIVINLDNRSNSE
jgi:NADH-ubiquinone oxidoreductase chain 6